MFHGLTQYTMISCWVLQHTSTGSGSQQLETNMWLLLLSRIAHHLLLVVKVANIILLWSLLTSFNSKFSLQLQTKIQPRLGFFLKKNLTSRVIHTSRYTWFFFPSFLPFNIYILKNYWPVSPSSVLRPRRRGPVNGDECYFWRTTGCHFEDKCRYKHIPDQKGNDRKPWLP